MSFLDNIPRPPSSAPVPVLNFARENTQLRDFLRKSPDPLAVQAGQMVHTPVIGACTVCKLSGSVDVPADMNYKTADNMLEGRIVKVFCPKCRKVTEFRPLSPEELNEEQFHIMKRYYDIYKAEKVAGRPVPEHIEQFMKAYDERIAHVMAKKGLPPLPGSGVRPPEPDRKIIVPG
jgi:ribosomal protein L33